MDMQFTLKEIENTSTEAKEYLEKYQNSIEELDRIINELSQSWVSKETKTYESFYSNYKNNYLKLVNMQQMIQKFCDNLDNQKQELEEMSKEIQNRFE